MAHPTTIIPINSSCVVPNFWPVFFLLKRYSPSSLSIDVPSYRISSAIFEEVQPGLEFRLLQWNFWIQMIQYEFSTASSKFLKSAKHKIIFIFSSCFSLGLYKWLNEHFPILLMISIFLSWDLAAGGCCWSFDFKFPSTAIKYWFYALNALKIIV